MCKCVWVVGQSVNGIFGSYKPGHCVSRLSTQSNEFNSLNQAIVWVVAPLRAMNLTAFLYKISILS